MFILRRTIGVICLLILLAGWVWACTWIWHDELGRAMLVIIGVCIALVILFVGVGWGLGKKRNRP